QEPPSAAAQCRRPPRPPCGSLRAARRAVSRGGPQRDRIGSRTRDPLRAGIRGCTRQQRQPRAVMTALQTLTLALDARSYPIHVGAGTLREAGRLLASTLPAPRTVI